MTIIIVGAGMSGLTAGLTLLFHNITNFIILESSSRFGGRLDIKEFGNGYVNLGTQTVGSDNEKDEYLQILKEKELITTKNDYFWKSVPILSNGDKISIEIVEKIKIKLDSILNGIVDKRNDLDGTLGDELRKRFLNEIEDIEGADEAVKTQFLELYEKYYCTKFGFETLSDITVKDFKVPNDIYYEVKANGTQEILDALEEHFEVTGIKDKILFDKKVIKVFYDKQSQNESVQITCHDGTSYFAEHVIITLPLGVLKETHSSTFVPPLPESKVNIIQSLGIGSTNKIFLEFDTAWWDSEWTGVNFLWRKNELSRIKNTRYFWIKGIVGLNPFEGQSNVLEARIHGKNSIVIEFAKYADLQKGFKYLLQHFLKVEVKPSKILVTKWNTDLNFRESHTYNSVSAEMFGVSRQELPSPILNSKGSPVIILSGDFTSPDNYGTLIGAIETGKRDALQVVEYLSGKMPVTRDSYLSTNRLEKSVDVLILGAGAAGIGAARKLDAANLTYLILEGSDEVGGRIRNKYMTNTNPNLKEHVAVSAGAQWLHGRRNPLYTYAKNKNLTVFDKSQEESGLFMRDDGIEIEANFAEQIDTIIEDILEEADEIYYEENDLKYPESLDKFMTDRFERKIRFLSNDKKIQARQLLDWHKRSITIDNAADDFKKISAKHWGRFEYVGGKWEHISLKNGFAEVLGLMAKDLGSDKFFFNKVVEKIHWASEMTYDEEKNPQKRNVLVKCTDGSLYSANHVIVTFSLGVLKHDADRLFLPALPQKHRDAIDCLGFGAITKVFLQFESNWWGDDEGIQFVYRENDYDEEENKNFLRYMTGFELVYTGPKNTLIGWVGGKGVEILENLDDKEIIDAIMKHLEKFVGYTVSYPKRYFISRWLGNPLTRGSYSFASIDCDANNITPKDLAAKITFKDQYANSTKTASTVTDGSPLLQFAGEGSSQVYYSTAHGAYLSGEDAAKAINKQYVRSKSVMSQIFDMIEYTELLVGLGFAAGAFIEDILDSL
uniref:CSON010572 protein n=1 Tax=Culicoides sonorensis TaxID=179676 RepID=A0A336KIV9_CULSO